MPALFAGLQCKSYCILLMLARIAGLHRLAAAVRMPTYALSDARIQHILPARDHVRPLEAGGEAPAICC